MRICSILALFLASLTLASVAGTAEADNEGTMPVIIILKDQPLGEVGAQVNAEIGGRIEAEVSEAKGIYAKIEPLSKKERRGKSLQEVRQYEERFLTKKDRRILGEIGSEIDSLKDEARRRIIEEVNAKTSSSHDEIRNIIERCGGKYTGSTAIINSVTALLPQPCLNDLQNHEDVLAIIENKKMQLDLDVGSYSIKSDVFWNASINGSGFEVAITDTGLDEKHPALNNSVNISKTFHDDAQGDPSYNDDPNSTDDLHGHGTHVAGIAASRDGTYKGIAFGANIINAKVCFRDDAGSGLCYEGDNRKGIDWAVEQGADIISRSISMCSVGESDCDLARYLDAVVDELGVHVANSAGNGGPGASTVGAVAYNAFSVAAVDDAGTVSTGDDSIAGFSSRGLTSDGRIKPDIAAPGVTIKSANSNWEGGSQFVDKSGTSMAAPHVAGAIALILDYKGINWNPMAVRALLFNTANSTGDKTAYGFGYLDLDRAYSFKDDVLISNITEGSFRLYKALLLPGERATLAWNRHATYNGIDYPNAWYSLNNLDLHLYNETSNSAINSSESSMDNAEQVKADIAYDRAVLKIKAKPANFSHGSDIENFALATDGGYAEANIILKTTIGTPAIAGRRFNVTSQTENSGDLHAHGVQAFLVLPLKTSILSGDNPRSLGSIENNTKMNVTWEVEAEEDGNYSFFAISNSTSYGEFFESASENANTIVDTMQPGISFASPTPPNDSYVNGSSVVINITSSESLSSAKIEWDSANYTMNGSGTQWHRTMQGQADGEHYYKIYAADFANRTNVSEARTVKIDTVIPQITVINPDSDYFTISQVPLDIELSENVTLLNYSAHNESTLCSNCDNYSGTLGMPDGIYSMTFRAKDRAGNTGMKTTLLTVDTSAPVINSYNYANDTAFAGGNRKFGMNYTELWVNESRFYWKENGTAGFTEKNVSCINGTYMYCQSSINLNQELEHYENGTRVRYYFLIKDRLGRVTEGPIYEISIDKFAPNITSTTANPKEGMNGQIFEIKAEAEDSSELNVTATVFYQNFTENITLINSSRTSFAGTWAAPKTPENYTYTVTAEDEAGNAVSTNGSTSTGVALLIVTDHTGVCSGGSYTIGGNLTWNNGSVIANKTITYAGIISGAVITENDGSFSMNANAQKSGDTNFTVNSTAVSDVSSLTTVNCAPPASNSGSNGGGGGGGGFSLPPKPVNKTSLNNPTPPENQEQQQEENIRQTITAEAETPAAEGRNENPRTRTEVADGVVSAPAVNVIGFLTANSRALGIVLLFAAGLVYEIRRIRSRNRRKLRRERQQG